MASRKFVFPWPLSPTRAMPSPGKAMSARSMLRKSRRESASSVTCTGGRSGAAELRRALLQECACALAHVGGGLEGAEEAGLEAEAVVQRRVEAGVHRGDGAREGDWGVLEHRERDQSRGVEQCRRFDHRVRQTDAQCLD